MSKESFIDLDDYVMYLSEAYTLENKDLVLFLTFHGAQKEQKGKVVFKYRRGMEDEPGYEIAVGLAKGQRAVGDPCFVTGYVSSKAYQMWDGDKAIGVSVKVVPTSIRMKDDQPYHNKDLEGLIPKYFEKRNFKSFGDKLAKTVQKRKVYEASENDEEDDEPLQDPRKKRGPTKLTSMSSQASAGSRSGQQPAMSAKERASTPTLTLVESSEEESSKDDKGKRPLRNWSLKQGTNAPATTVKRGPGRPRNTPAVVIPIRGKATRRSDKGASSGSSDDGNDGKGRELEGGDGDL
ncbi:hypothetical protein BGZ83_001079 [Gryganskiella cystojenkinii]|nr:hypothetical protein BGZ83_001079 [Gryganskiella cystojenkinii]